MKKAKKIKKIKKNELKKIKGGVVADKLQTDNISLRQNLCGVRKNNKPGY